MNLINIGQNKYFPSNSIQVFPCSYRGTNNTSIIDPESRMQTEANYTRLGGSEKTYVISYPTTSNSELVFMLNGYYFKVTGISAATDFANDNVYLHIKLAEVDITAANNTTVLSSWEDSAVKYLDKLGTADNNSRVNGFTGLLITDAADTAGSWASIQIKANGAWNQAALLPNNIAHGETVGSVSIGAGLVASKDNQVIIGKYNAPAPDADIIIADGTDTENRSNKVIIDSTETQLANSTILLSTGAVDLELDTGSMHLTNGSNELNFTATDTQLTLKAKPAESGPGNIVFIGSGNKLYKAPFSVTLDKAKDAVTDIRYVSEISYNNDGKLTFDTRPIVCDTGTSQGQFKINNRDVDVKDLSTVSSPSFKNITATEKITSKTADIADKITTKELVLSDGTNNVTLDTKDVSASNKLTANYMVAKTDAKITTLKIGNANDVSNTHYAELSLDVLSTGKKVLKTLQIKQANGVAICGSTGEEAVTASNTGTLTAKKSVVTPLLNITGKGVDAGIMFKTDNANKFLIYNKDDSALTITKGNQTGTEYISFNADTDATITVHGSTTFESAITANATATLTGKVTLKSDLEADGTISAAHFVAKSDKRLKENIVDYRNDKSILDLPVYKFDYINGTKDNIGCLAQDLREICPEIVHENSNGYLSIEESKLVYLLLNEVKQLRKEIDELKK